MTVLAKSRLNGLVAGQYMGIAMPQVATHHVPITSALAP